MTYSAERREEIIAKVIDGLSQGMPLTLICDEDGMPCDRSIRDWADEDPELSSAIARAREAGFDRIAREGLAIVDDKTEDPASRRVRADYRLKLLAKWDPKRYGDKITHGNDPDNPLPAAVINVGFRDAGS